jgi:hypothetical protein
VKKRKMSVTWTKEPSRKPIQIPQRSGMKQSTEGLLFGAAECCRGRIVYRHLADGLEQLHDHIEELRENPTEENLGEFLSLYV